MKYMIDIDGTICTPTTGDYLQAEPFKERIAYFNKLYDEGHEIHYWTARGMSRGLDFRTLTYEQFQDWGVKYSSVKFGKPVYDLWIDDKAVNSEEFFNDFSNGP